MNNLIKRTWVNTHLVQLDDLTGMVFQHEDGGHTFEISGSDGSSPLTLSGTVSCVFVRPDNADITIAGTISSGKASVTLTDECYYTTGRFFVTIFLTSDGQKTAIYAGFGTVARTSGGAVAGDTPQDVAYLIAEIEQYSALLDSVANGHGGIKSIVKTGSTGTNPVVDTYTLTYADDDTFQFTLTNGVKGDAGPAASVTSQSVQYQAGDSYDTPPTGTWQSSPPSVPQGKYLWTKTSVTYSDNTTVVSYSVARQGIDGAGSVSSVCNVSPDGNGNVALTATNVGAAATVNSISPDVNGNVTLTSSDVGAVPTSGSNGFLYRSSNAVSEKELYKSLWTGTWSSSDITVDGLSNYNLFQIRIARKSDHTQLGTCILAMLGGENLDALRGQGGHASSGSAYVNYYFNASRSGDVLTFTACYGRNGPSSASDVAMEVIEIIGII